MGNEHIKDSMCVFDYPFSLPADPSLTVENICEVLKGVNLNQYDQNFDIPYSVSEKIENQCHGNLSDFNRAFSKEYLDSHPAPSWAHIAEDLFRSSEHDVLKQLERQHPIGM